MIKNYDEFCKWLDNKNLDCGYDTKNVNNDTIVIFKKERLFK